MAVGRELPDDLIADVVRHLPPHSLAVSRCVCRAWRDLVDARRLLRADLLPRSVGGIFMNYRALYSPEFFSRPTTGPSISGDLGFIPGFSTVVDHCNGLLLVTETSDDYVANPATRRWARLPPRPTSQMGEACDQIECLVYDPTVSPHYNIDPEMMQSEWPPSSLQVFSSITGCWEERSFALEEGSWDLEERLFVSERGRMVRIITHTKVYWREALYVLCKNGFVLSQQHKGPWILQDINNYKYPYDNGLQREVVDDNFEWNSDDDNVLNTDDMVEGHFEGYTGLLGFHPYKEIVFLNSDLYRVVAYHWNTSKFQDLGNIFPKEYLEVAGHCAGINTSFT
uniref:F-box domain-containing protein n=1 Tax=Setaria italica TaxID=4555 RepID=K4AKQ3_SETIT